LAASTRAFCPKEIKLRPKSDVFQFRKHWAEVLSVFVCAGWTLFLLFSIFCLGYTGVRSDIRP
jgi:hypothetical protein